MSNLGDSGRTWRVVLLFEDCSSGQGSHTAGVLFDYLLPGIFETVVYKCIQAVNWEKNESPVLNNLFLDFLINLSQLNLNIERSIRNLCQTGSIWDWERT